MSSREARRAPAVLAGSVDPAAPAGRIAADDLPVLMLHGAKDRLVPIAGQEKALLALEAGGVDARLERFPSGHRMTPEQVEAVDAFTRRVLGCDPA